MKILHVSPHLGGGIGKAHAAMVAHLSETVDQTFVLLEPPRDRRHVEAIEAAGARVIVADSLDQVGALTRAADIVQFEFWNHPRLFGCLARCDFPAMRTVFWSHISGLFNPVIPPGLIEVARRFVATTEASNAVPAIAALRETAPHKFVVINSGFGFADAPPLATTHSPTVCYLGTVDFAKMHPWFFDAIDSLARGTVEASVWGDVSRDVAIYAGRMRHPQRVVFHGQTAEPAQALTRAGIFFYPLQRDHYGTAENALVEAMSLGLVPVVLDNPAEMAIVKDGESGFIAQSIDESVVRLQMLLASAELRARIGQAAIRSVAETRTPALSARKFRDLWQGLLCEPARHVDFRKAIGNNPAEWFLATQRFPGATCRPDAITSRRAAKGTLTHFQAVFAGDSSLEKLRG